MLALPFVFVWVSSHRKIYIYVLFMDFSGKFFKGFYVVDGIVDEIVYEYLALLLLIFNSSSDEYNLDGNLYELRTLNRLQS